MRNIKVLGPGCAKCERLFENVEKAVSELGIECEVEKVTDIETIVGYDIMLTPALVVDEEVKSAGKALSVNDLKTILGA